MDKGHLPQSPIWIFPKEAVNQTEQIIKEFNLHPVTAQVLLSRGLKNLDDINAYLYAKLPNLISPSCFHDMDHAVARLYTAIKSQENILVYGDNDVDGITGTALLTEFLTFIGANAFYYVPNRTAVRESILLDALDFAKKKNCSLLITVDCGITAASEVDEIIKNNLDVIITDHHEPIAKIPNCVATLNPKLINSTYPNKDITGVGVAFKLAHALTNLLISKGEIGSRKIDLKKYLDLVALGTIADMGALIGENRILVRYGLKQLNKTKRIGLVKLMHVCELKPGSITTTDIASKIAPRLNSLGRIADPLKGVELLLIKDQKRAEELAKELDLNNLERQKIEKKDSDDITEYTLKHPEIFMDRAIVLSSDKWHPGIIPIITARLSKQYNRPTIIIAIDEGVGKGSIRTISEFPILPALRENADLLINFGGHNFAAGLTIKEENIEEFKKRFIAKANSMLSDADVLPKLQLDAKIDFKELTFDFLESLQLLEPFGTENPMPVFYTEAKQAWPPKVVGKLHLKLYLEQNDRMLEGIAFGMAHRKRELTRKNLILQIAFSPQINTFLNKSSIQLQIKDFKIN
ncbi:MAG: single-stranded-DNA-specific exonuclease RecJ [Simkaniaceae bacterium]